MDNIFNKEYDYLIVGAGLYGAIFAYEANKANRRCLVIDKRSHSGGNVYCEEIEGINVHKYGAHIFHTDDQAIWNYVNQFAQFNNYVNSPLADVNGELFNLPFNMNTFYQLWKTRTPAEARNKIQAQINELKITNPSNLEEQAMLMVGRDIYEKFIRHYTEKQWGRKATELPTFIIKRIPLRFSFNNNYFNDRYQGIPIGGYNKIIDTLLKNIDVRLNTDYNKNKDFFSGLAKKIVYTGKIDELFNYEFGALEYRSLNFEHSLLRTSNYQGNAVINYCGSDVPYTRVIEHKHFESNSLLSHTVITREYPLFASENSEPFYPINDEKNNQIYRKYKDLATTDQRLILGGRLANYRYYDMHQVIGAALSQVRRDLAI